MSKCEWDEYGAGLQVPTDELTDRLFRREDELTDKADKADPVRAARYRRNTALDTGLVTYWGKRAVKGRVIRRV